MNSKLKLLVAAAAVIVVEGSLSFLGLSVQLPTATWGNMINQARRDIKANFGQVLYPSIILTLTVLALNQVGDFFHRGRLRVHDHHPRARLRVARARLGHTAARDLHEHASRYL